MTPSDFNKKFSNLIILTWLFPPVIGLSFIVYIGVMDIDQMIDVILSPLEPAYIVGFLLFALLYLKKYVEPLKELIGDKELNDSEIQLALARLQGFPQRYWGLFLAYLLIAPVTVMWAAQIFSEYSPRLIDFFRIELISLIVAIVVGLPIFFRLMDLFGVVVSRLHLTKPYVSFKTKIFLIGAMTPLLIDTMLVQYFWTRTGFFSLETFVIWLALEIIAVAGSLFFVKSFAQSLRPLQDVLENKASKAIDPEQLRPTSTDELGVLTGDYREMLIQRDELLKRTQESERELHTIFKEMQDAFIRLGVDGTVLKTSPSIERLIGYTQQEIEGKNITLYMLDATDFARAESEAAESEGYINGFETALKSKSGEIVWISTNARFQADGEQAYYEGMMHDISKRKIAEDSLAQYKNNLEKLIEERTKELQLTQAELIKSEKMATLGQLTATVSHELRNPLGAVKVSAFLLRHHGTTGNKNFDAAMSRLEKNVERCDQIIDELLDYTRSQSIKPKPIEFDRWLEELLGDYVFLSPLKVELAFESDATAYIDSERMRRAIFNLIDNAVHAMYEPDNYPKLKEGAVLKIKTFRRDHEMLISIEDNGVGMDAETIKRIYEPLFSTKSFGVGLGMPIVKQIVEQHGGELEIQSQTGHGTRAEIVLPLGENNKG